mmetsp:Transcript_20132/g.56055  ORF Transcript_20132/g.56055 Transcript_20132/m.56055 type:complete len:242 (-) Transcript_20132:634-1359(-)
MAYGMSGSRIHVRLSKPQSSVNAQESPEHTCEGESTLPPTITPTNTDALLCLPLHTAELPGSCTAMCICVKPWYLRGEGAGPIIFSWRHLRVLRSKNHASPRRTGSLPCFPAFRPPYSTKPLGAPGKFTGKIAAPTRRPGPPWSRGRSGDKRRHTLPSWRRSSAHTSPCPSLLPPYTIITPSMTTLASRYRLPGVVALSLLLPSLLAAMGRRAGSGLAASSVHLFSWKLKAQSSSKSCSGA